MAFYFSRLGSASCSRRGRRASGLPASSSLPCGTNKAGSPPYGGWRARTSCPLRARRRAQLAANVGDRIMTHVQLGGDAPRGPAVLQRLLHRGELGVGRGLNHRVLVAVVAGDPIRVTTRRHPEHLLPNLRDILLRTADLVGQLPAAAAGELVVRQRDGPAHMAVGRPLAVGAVGTKANRRASVCGRRVPPRGLPGARPAVRTDAVVRSEPTPQRTCDAPVPKWPPSRSRDRGSPEIPPPGVRFRPPEGDPTGADALLSTAAHCAGSRGTVKPHRGWGRSGRTPATGAGLGGGVHRPSGGTGGCCSAGRTAMSRSCVSRCLLQCVDKY